MYDVEQSDPHHVANDVCIGRVFFVLVQDIKECFGMECLDKKTGKPARARPSNTQWDKRPPSTPTLSKQKVGPLKMATRSSG